MTREQEILLKMAKKALSADTSSDLISRANAIRWVKTECNQYGKPTLDYDSGLKVIEHLKKMPSELPSAEAGWIPCSERLPKEYAQYLVCLKSGECYVYWLKDSDWARGMAEKEGILAWMPLPKPYREDGE